MVRDGANTIGIDDLDVTRFVGDIWDNEVLREAMAGFDVVYYCVVDTRGWLRDPAPLFRTNVDGTRNVLEVAKDAGLHRFVFTSSYVTVGRKRGRIATEDDAIVDRGLTPYVRSRVQAEKLVLSYARDHGLPAVAMCVSTTYGAGDWGRTPHGAIIAGTAFGKLPFVMDKIELEAVGVDDAARAMILAAEKGRVGERYLISEKMITNAEVVRIAAEAAGVPPPDQDDPAAAVVCDGSPGQRQGPAARHRRAAVAGLAAADACRGAGGLRQGEAGTRLAAKAGRGVDPGSRQVLGRPARGQAQDQVPVGGQPRLIWEPAFKINGGAHGGRVRTTPARPKRRVRGAGPPHRGRTHGAEPGRCAARGSRCRQKRPARTTSPSTPPDFAWHVRPVSKPTSTLPSRACISYSCRCWTVSMTCLRPQRDALATAFGQSAGPAAGPFPGGSRSSEPARRRPPLTNR